MVKARLWLFSTVALLLMTLGGPAQAGVTERVSVSSAGAQGDYNSLTPAISPDGRFVAFESEASNLVAGDTNAKADVFVRDRLTGATERVSVSVSGAQANDGSGGPAISADGRFVAFQSDAANLVPGDTSGYVDVFVRDRVGATTERVSVSSSGEQADAGAVEPSISADGHFVAFTSAASNLAPGDTNFNDDIFVRDRETGITERVSVSSAGLQGEFWSHAPSISADGRFVAFSSFASTLVPGDTNGKDDVFVRDRQTSVTERVSVASTGEQGNSFSTNPSVSADGQLVAFTSQADNLMPVSTSGAPEIFVRDRQAGVTHWVSAGAPEDYYSMDPAISGDGRFVAFFSGNDDETDSDILVYDRQTGVTEFASVSSTGAQGNGRSYYSSISGDGEFVAFASEASNLVPADTNGYRDVFVRDRFGSPEIVPPETFISFGPCGLVVSAGSASICWSGSDDETPASALMYSWRLDSGSWQPFSSATCANPGLSAGSHTFEVRARDWVGNVDASPAQCQFTVDLSGPSVSVTAPAQGATVKGTVTVSATASHASGIQKVDFYAAGALIYTDSSAPFSCQWDTTAVSAPEGLVSTCAKAYSVDARVAWHCVQVTVDNTTFDDVPKSSALWLYVEALAAAGVTGGCSADPPLYCPTGSVTRAQMAKFLCIAAGKEPLDRATPTFADVPKTHWAYGFVERLADAASWGGTPPTGGCRVVGTTRYLCPNDPVTREQMAKFLCVASGRSQMPTCAGTFADVTPASAFCRFIERLANPASWPGGVAVTGGCAVGPPRLYCPKDNVTRGQMAVFLVKAFGITL